MRLTNDDFADDMAAVKAGIMSPSEAADKWGARGGAFVMMKDMESKSKD